MVHNMVLSVSQLNRYMKSLVEQAEVLKDVFIQGEISNFKGHYSSGHFYFTLKDEDSAVKAVMFKSFASLVPFVPENGMMVLVRGEVAVYERDGVYQIYCREMLPGGLGSLQLAFDQRKKKLAALGLFDEEKKKKIPAYPETIGLITAKNSAAYHDIISVLQNRFPAVHVLFCPALVQGEKAPEELMRALELLDGRCDVIILGRGGGSFEDLWCFNDENLAQKVFACKTPVISAVGHETDFTICDFVADLRAPTPTAAAQMAVPDVLELRAQLAGEKEQIHQLAKASVSCFSAVARRTALEQKVQLVFEQHLVKVRSYHRLLKEKAPAQSILYTKAQVTAKKQALNDKIKRNLDRAVFSLSQRAEVLDRLSPLKVLSKGYTLVKKDGEIVRTAKALSEKDRITILFSDGERQAIVQKEE